ncbi:hypothetical protein GOP47_0025627 [Adiantum capillus-veneris]|uniref:Beta-glucosidase n=1 Tax=Adiantum capillus-veneris TaxID=13818 RepID=A0A9D4U0W3_ADICA|nr:hypothetical protein GOP47_0025627 [Adiantum capillus-veneris]
MPMNGSANQRQGIYLLALTSTSKRTFLCMLKNKHQGITRVPRKPVVLVSGNTEVSITLLVAFLVRKRMCPPVDQALKKNGQELRREDFPHDFLFGSATSAYQIEGASREGSKGISIWDSFAGTPGKIEDGSSGDVACDHYNLYKEDVNLMSSLGFTAYRFSISWARIFPDGFGNVVSQEGIQFYNNLIDSLIEKGIKPFVTLYHWDLPQPLEDKLGGWLSPEIPKYFVAYAEACFKAFGDRVKHWITLNEPARFAILGHCLGIHAPGRSSNRSRSLYGDSSVEPYVVGHHALLAHAAAVKVYREKYKEKQGGLIGLAVDSEWPEPLTSSLEDRQASQRHLEFMLGWFLDPIYFGKYPTSMSESLGERLPRFTAEQMAFIHGSVDFIGINHYFSAYVTTRHAVKKNSPWSAGWYEDVNTFLQFERNGEPIGEKGASFWMYNVPWGFGKLLKWLTDRYNRPVMFITENGTDEENDPSKSLTESLHDTRRVRILQEFLFFVSQAIRAGADIRGYFVWSLLDNFEWSVGYTKRFGIVFVDYNDNTKRYPKDSALWFKKFLASPPLIKLQTNPLLLQSLSP